MELDQEKRERRRQLEAEISGYSDEDEEEESLPIVCNLTVCGCKTWTKHNLLYCGKDQKRPNNQNLDAQTHTPSLTHTLGFICSWFMWIYVYSGHVSPAELKMSEDGPVQVQVLDAPTDCHLSTPPSQCDHQDGRENEGRTHNVLKCWILLVLVVSVF